MSLHRLLRRQIDRLGLGVEAPPDAGRWMRFLECVSATYAQSDESRHLVERSMELSSREMRELHERERRANELLEERVRLRTAELERTELAARDDKERLQRALDASRLALWDYDLASGKVYISEIWSELLGGPHVPTATTIEALVELVPEQDRPAIRAAIVPVLKGECANYQVEHRVRKPGGGEIWILSAGRVIERDPGGRAVRAVGTNLDVTGRKRVEQALRAAEEQFRGLVEQTIAAIYIIQDEKLAYVNPRYAEIFGYDSADELIGRDALSLVAEKDRAIQAERLRQRLAGEPLSAGSTFIGVRKDGSMIDVGVQGARATHHGRPAVIGLMQDISEKRRAEEAIQRYVVQLESAFMSTVGVATIMSEMRDPYTAGHERRVGEIAVAIGAELGLDARRQEGLRVAGYLHDIGKITIPSEILSKPGKLSAVEYKLIQGHPQASHDVLRTVEFPWPVAGVALQHHERIDGSGYPAGLKGEAMLLEARIMAVADVVEAMSSHRPYRAGLGIEMALAEIERGRGTEYDADAADACLRLFREKGYQLPE